MGMKFPQGGFTSSIFPPCQEEHIVSADPTDLFAKLRSQIYAKRIFKAFHLCPYKNNCTIKAVLTKNIQPKNDNSNDT